MLEELDINWSVFTPKENEHLARLINAGMWQHLATVVVINPEKEVELEKIVAFLKPQDIGFESSVAKEYLGVDIKTPEQEAEVQAKLEAEFKGWKEKNEEKKVKKEKLVKQPDAPVEAPIKKRGRPAKV